MSTTGRRTTRSSGYVTRAGNCRANSAHTTIQLDHKPRDGIEAPAASQTKDGIWQYVSVYQHLVKYADTIVNV